MKLVLPDFFSFTVVGVIITVIFALLAATSLFGCSSGSKTTSTEFATAVADTTTAMKDAGFSGRMDAELDLDQIGEFSHVLRGPGRAHISASAEINSAERHMLDSMIAAILGGLQSANDQNGRLLGLLEANSTKNGQNTEKTPFLAEKPTLEPPNGQNPQKPPIQGPGKGENSLLRPLPVESDPIAPPGAPESPEVVVPGLEQALREDQTSAEHV